jgi:hypothetical protein
MRAPLSPRRRAAHHRRPDKEARLEGLGRRAVAVAITPVIGVHEDVGAALQFGVYAAPRLELEGAGAACNATPESTRLSIVHRTGY